MVWAATGGGTLSLEAVDHRKPTLAKGSRWDYTPLPFEVGIPT